MKKIKRFIDEVISEMKKVVWPKRNVVWVSTILVIIICVFFGVALGIFDRLIAEALRLFLKLA